MPQYEFECQKCGHVKTVLMRATDYDQFPRECDQYHWNEDCKKETCAGRLEQNIAPAALQFKGHGWTPRRH